MTLTLWAGDAEAFDGSQRPVVAVRAASVSEFGGGKTLSVRGSTVLRVNPDLPEAHRLRGWFDNGGSTQDITNMSAR